MRKFYIACFSVLYLLPAVLFCQEAVVKGKITDNQSGEALTGVNVVLEDNTGTATDVNGNYELKVAAGRHTVLFRFVGYKSLTKTLDAKAGETTVLDIILSEAATELGTVVVSAGKFEQELSEVTVSMEILKPELVENKGTYNMEMMMDQIPGVHVTDGQVNIRGGSGFSYGAGSRVMVLVDDLPILSADANDVKWIFLPLENLEQVEVIKGASSALFGSSALNGVINIRTAWPTSEPQTKINIFQGIYNDPVRMDTLGSRRDSLGDLHKPLKWWARTNPMYTGMNFFHSRKIKNFDLVVGGNAFSDQGYREGETEQRFRLNFNTRYRFPGVEGLSAGVNANAQINDGGLFLLWQDADSGAYRPLGGLDTPATTVSNFTTIRVSVDPFITYYTKKQNRHSLRGRWFNSTNRNDTGQESIADLFYSEYQFQKHFKKDMTMTFGMTNTYSLVRSELYGDHYGTNFAGFYQVDKKYKRLTVSLGLRGEYYRIDTAETVSTVKWKSGTLPFQPVLRSGVNYRLFKATWMRASFGQGYRFPSIAEKFISTSVGALNIFPNPELQPEKGWSAEIGVRQGFRISNWNGYLDVAGFWTEYLDMMEFTAGIYNPDSLPPTFQWFGFKSQNVGKAQIKGLDATVAGKGKILGIETTVLCGYTYMMPVNFNNDSAYLATRSDTSSNMLKYRFNHLAKADIQFDYKKWSMGWSMRYNSYLVNIDVAFEQPFILQGLKEYREEHQTGDVVFDARISYWVSKESKVALISNNLFNREYMGRPGDMQPPRTVALHYTLSF